MAELSVFAFMESGAFLAGRGVESLSIIITHEGKKVVLLMRHGIRETSQLPPSKRTLKWFLLRRPLYPEGTSRPYVWLLAYFS